MTTHSQSRPVRSVRNFTAAFLTLLTIPAVSSMVVPLLATFRTSLGLTNSEAAMTTVAYFGGAGVSLIFFGRLSNLIGRKPAAVIALLMISVVLWLLASVDNIRMLFLARALQGLATGLVTSGVIAWAVETIPWVSRSGVIAAGGPAMGFTVGAAAVGVGVDGLGMSPSTLFIAAGAVVLLALVLVARATETVKKPRDDNESF